MPRFVFSRASVVDELFTVDAEDLETAQQLVYDGAPEVKIEQGEWIDWYHEEYTLESEEDDLVTFVKSKSNPKYVMTEEQKDQIRNSRVPYLIKGLK